MVIGKTSPLQLMINRNKLALSIMLFILICGFILVVLLLIRQKGTSPVIPPVLPTQIPYPTYEILPTIRITITPIQGEKIQIKEILVNNFYKSPVAVNANGDVLIKENTNYQIVYLSPFKQFILSILGSPFDKYKSEAEGELLRVLGVDEKIVCQLDVVVNTPEFANPDLAGTNSPLSFCK